MESGERELKQAFEEVTTRNVRAILQHSNETRVIARDLEKKVVLLQETIREQVKEIQALKNQLANVQTKIFSGGT